MTENPSMLAIVVRSFGGPEALNDVHNLFAQVPLPLR